MKVREEQRFSNKKTMTLYKENGEGERGERKRPPKKVFELG